MHNMHLFRYYQWGQKRPQYIVIQLPPGYTEKSLKYVVEHIENHLITVRGSLKNNAIRSVEHVSGVAVLDETVSKT